MGNSLNQAEASRECLQSQSKDTSSTHTFAPPLRCFLCIFCQMQSTGWWKARQPPHLCARIKPHRAVRSHLHNEDIVFLTSSLSVLLVEDLGAGDIKTLSMGSILIDIQVQLHSVRHFTTRSDYISQELNTP